MKNTQKGFTLVELLVVIAILAILAGVSVVGYTSFIGDSNDKATMSEASDIHNAILNACTLNSTTGVKISVGGSKVAYCELKDGGAGYTIAEYNATNHASAVDITSMIGAGASKLTLGTGKLTYANRDFSYDITGSGAPTKVTTP